MAAAPGWTREGEGSARGTRGAYGEASGADSPVDGNAHSLPVHARSLPAGNPHAYWPTSGSGAARSRPGVPPASSFLHPSFGVMGPGRAAWTALGAALGLARGKPTAVRGCGRLWSGVWPSPRVPRRPSSSVSGWGQLVPEKSPRGAAGNGPRQPNFLGKKQNCLFSGAFGGSGAGGSHGGEKLSLQDIAELIQTKACQRVVVMVGAGISTPSGIPDFRSPGSGLYSNLEQYDLPYPEAIFELDYFFHNPKPFFALAKELYPGNYRPNLAHYFLRLLHDKGLLLRLYTQNIDGLERAAGIPAAKLVEAHGTFASATCTICRQSFPGEEFRVDVMADRVPRCPVCTGVIKPDIIFFGEQLPQRFFLHMVDFPMADLLIIIGTSLEVWSPRGRALRQPVGSLQEVRAPGADQPRAGGTLRLAAPPQRRGPAGRHYWWRGEAGEGPGLDQGDPGPGAERDQPGRPLRAAGPRVMRHPLPASPDFKISWKPILSIVNKHLFSA